MSGRVSRVFGLHHPRRGPIPVNSGPIHAVLRPHRGASALAWCAVRAQFRHWRWEGTESDVTCKGAKHVHSVEGECLRRDGHSMPCRTINTKGPF